MHHALRHDLVVLAVARIIVVVDQGAEHGTTLPPEVWIRQVPWHVSRPISRVVGHHAMGTGLRGGLDGI